MQWYSQRTEGKQLHLKFYAKTITRKSNRDFSSIAETKRIYNSQTLIQLSKGQTPGNRKLNLRKKEDARKNDEQRNWYILTKSK